MKKSRFSEEQITYALRLAEPGTPVVDAGADDLPVPLRMLTITRSNHVWAMDITTSRWREASSIWRP